MNLHDRSMVLQKISSVSPPPRRAQTPRVEVLEQRIAPAVFTVLNIDDTGPGSLRQALLDANALPDADTIAFAIAGTGPHVIQPLSALPTISTVIFIDGYTQPGASANTLAVGSNATLSIVLDGSLADDEADGLRIESDGNVVRGLVIHSFADFSGGSAGNGISISGSNNRIEGNYIGTDDTGLAGPGNENHGVLVSGPDNLIGGLTPEARNVISANGIDGISLGGTLSSGGNRTFIRGNYIGTDATGLAALGNLGGGIYATTSSNTIGGTTIGARNVISGNLGGSGITLGEPDENGNSTANDNTIRGNYIGLDAAGMEDLGNALAGVSILGARGNSVGGGAIGAGNVISGNTENGVEILGGRGNAVQGNAIGVNASGTAALPNASSGVYLLETILNAIGGRGREANLISGNLVHGVDLEDSGQNTVQGNFIGTGAAGTGTIGNGDDGIHIAGAFSEGNLIGGAASGLGNQIFGNATSGVTLDGTGSGNHIVGNSIAAHTGLGIDLVGADLPGVVTLNDGGDADAGTNDLQNFPVLAAAASTSSSTTIQGSLASSAGTRFTVDFYSSAALNASGFGEGEIYLGSIDVVSDGSGTAAFDFVPSTVVPAGHFITATATNLAGSTSEFSAGRVVDLAAVTLSISDASVAEIVGGTALATFTVNLSRPSVDVVTVTYETVAGTATQGTDYVGVGPVLLTFAPGEVSQTFTVAVNNDTETELNETFFLNLSGATNATLVDAQGVGTIINVDVSAKGNAVTMTDPDGDKVTITTNKGDLTSENLVFNDDGTLQKIVLNGPEFAGANLTFKTDTRGAGNGTVDVGTVDATGMDLGKVKISGTLGMIVAGDGDPRKPALKSLTVGSLGTTDPTADPLLSEILGSLGTLTVTGNVQGAAVEVTGKLGKVTIGGDLVGDKGAGIEILDSLNEGRPIIRAGTSGGIPVGAFSAGEVGSFTVKKNMNGGSVTSAGNIGSVSVGGNLSGGTVAAAGTIKVVKVFGTLTSDDPDEPVVVAALGRVGAKSAAAAVAINSLKVNGNVENALILLGYEKADVSGETKYVAKNSDAGGGTVVVLGNWVASSLVAGVFDTTSDGFGRNDEVLSGDVTPKILASIASITIKGTATGSDEGGDHYGITAQKIGKLSINGEKIPLDKKLKDSLLLDREDRDFRLVEF